MASNLVTVKNVSRIVALLAAYKVSKSLFFPSKVKDLKGKAVLITGSAAGLGRTLALILAKKGEVSTLILWDIQAKELAATAELLKQANPNLRVLTQTVNLAVKDQIYANAQKCIADLGDSTPDVIVNNAGIISGGKGLLETPDERIELETRINMLAHVWMTKAFLPHMLSKRKKGHFVNVSSMAAYVAVGDMVPYAMSKKGAKGFAEGLAAETKLKGFDDLIKVSLICPSHIDTALFKGFSVAGNVTMTPEYCAGQIVNAIECELELVQLPRYLAPSVVFIALSEFLGRLNLPSEKRSAMKQWTPEQADKIFDEMKKSNI